VQVALRNDPALQELAATPLTLSVLTLAYQGKSVEDLQVAASPEARQQQVFETYVQRMLQHRGAHIQYKPQQTISWLGLLARQMTQHNQTVFYLERMQPDWLSDSQSHQLYRRSVRLFVGLVTGLFDGLFVALVIALLLNPLTRLASGRFVVLWLLFSVLGSALISGLCAGLTFGRLYGLQLLMGLVLVLVFWWDGRLIEGSALGQTLGLTVGLVYGGYVLTAGLVSILDHGLQRGLSSKVLDKHNLLTPNQGIQRSARNSLRIGLIFGLPIGVVYGLSFGLLSQLSNPLTNPLLFGLVSGLVGGIRYGLISGLVYGGVACIQHIVLRLLLGRARSVPWNYSHFLDYTAERILIRKVGGGYIFLHRLLLDFFAHFEDESSANT
jgi:hypothetical protein